jgi:flagellar biosynthesis protein FlhA
VGQTAPRLIEDLVPKVVSLGEIQKVLRQLLRERVPVKDLTTILEAISDASATTKDPDAITESVRSVVGRSICRQYQNEKGELPVVSLAPALEERLLQSVVRTEQGVVLAVEPGDAQRLATKVARVIENAVAQPVLLCTPGLRPHFWRLFARVLPQVAVLSHDEVPPQIQVSVLSVLD